MNQNDKIVLFYGDEFSNFHPCDFKYGDVWYNCSEQYYMSQKALYFNDMDTYGLIMGTKSPFIQKKLGRSVKGFEQSKWDKVKYNVMLWGCYLKFSQNAELKQMLLDTGEKLLAEASPTDKIWGIGLNQTNPDAFDPNNWDGTNMLGKVLMDIRGFIQIKEALYK